MECSNSHIKEIHSRGWGKDDPVKLNANWIEQLQMKNGTPFFIIPLWNFYNCGARTIGQS